MIQPQGIEQFSSSQFRRLLQPCIHCGLCLEACPTYSIFGTEMEAPRGRISMMRAVSENRISLTGALQKHLNLCLACRACETACPSGVQYGALIETARNILEKERSINLMERLLRWLTLRELLPHSARLRLIARLIWFYQKSGLQRLAYVLNVLPAHLKLMDALLPSMPAHRPNYLLTAPPIGVKRGTVAFFHGCIQDVFLAGVNEATVRVLQRNGFEVHVPRNQTCCGAAHIHLGNMEFARKLARQNIDAFLCKPVDEAGNLASGYDAIINNAGGCGAALKEYDRLLADDPLYAEKAKIFVSKVSDISEFLVENMNVNPRGELKMRVTYVDSCHLRHVQNVIQQPRQLLHSIPSLELVEPQKPDRCCGSAGVYNILQPETANAILDEKMADVAATGAEIIVVTNAGCYFQMLHGVKRAHLGARVYHLIELLDQSYSTPESDLKTEDLRA